MNISVVVPVYNSSACLQEVFDRICQVLPRAAEEWEPILVRDGSADNKWSVIREIFAKCGWARGIYLIRNSGQHAHEEICTWLDLGTPPLHVSVFVSNSHVRV